MRSRAAAPASLLAAAGIAAVGVAAAGSAGGSADESGIRGRVVPCGLVHERAAPCAFSAARAKVIVRAVPGGAATRVVRAGGDGRFRVAVPPGSYAVEARPNGAARQRNPTTVAATVPDGGWVTVVVPAGRMAPPAGRLGR
jgi:hypothetical protein